MTVYFLVLPNARSCRLMGSSTHLGPLCALAPPRRTNRPLPDPRVSTFTMWPRRLADGTRRFFLFGLAGAPDTEAALRFPHLCTLSVWVLMVLVVVSGSVSLYKRAGYTHTSLSGMVI